MKHLLMALVCMACSGALLAQTGTTRKSGMMRKDTLSMQRHAGTRSMKHGMMKVDSTMEQPHGGELDNMGNPVGMGDSSMMGVTSDSAMNTMDTAMAMPGSDTMRMRPMGKKPGMMKKPHKPQ